MAVSPLAWRRALAAEALPLLCCEARRGLRAVDARRDSAEHLV